MSCFILYTNVNVFTFVIECVNVLIVLPQSANVCKQDNKCVDNCYLLHRYADTAGG